MKKFLICFFIVAFASAQNQLDFSLLTLEEYLGWVKQYHPVAKQADLKLTEAEAMLLKARGAFDPKIAIDWDTKEFKSTDYYNILNSSFKIPTWFGIELAAGFERNSGVFLNPERTVPENGLYRAGISVPLGQGLFINERMAGLRQAQITQDLNEAERQIEVNNVIYHAGLAYFEWYVAYKEVELFEGTLEQAELRLQGVKRRAQIGDLPGIDTLEAGIIQQNRALSLEKANLKLITKRLELSNFLWINNNVPVELTDSVNPQEITDDDIHINPLLILQKKAIRLILNKERNIHTIFELPGDPVAYWYVDTFIKIPSDPLFKELEILKVHDIFKMTTLNFVYDSLNKLNPEQFHMYYCYMCIHFIYKYCVLGGI